MAYSYGSFSLNDNTNYYVVGKDSPSFTPITQTYYKIGRFEGMKKTGEVINEKHIEIDMIIIGLSRSDLENKIDALQQALNLRGQLLSTHANDARMYTADCVDCQIKFVQGNVLYCAAKVLFVATNPFPVAAASTIVDTTTQALNFVSGTQYKQTTATITGGGTVFARPVIRIYRMDSISTWVSIEITNNTTGAILNITSHMPTTNGGYIDVYCDPSGQNGFKALLNSTTTSCALNGIFPTMEAGTNSFDIDINMSGTGAYSSRAIYTWTCRYLS